MTPGWPRERRQEIASDRATSDLTLAVAFSTFAAIAAEIENMRTTILISGLLLLAVVGIPGLASADPCNGIKDTSCTCEYNVWFCSHGQGCQTYVAAVCVDGSSVS